MIKKKEISAKDFDPSAKDFDLKIYEVISYLEVYYAAKKLQQQKCWIDGWIWVTTNLPTRIAIQKDPQDLLCRENSYPEWRILLHLENYSKKNWSHKLFQGVIPCLKIEEEFGDNCTQIDIYLYMAQKVEQDNLL